MSTPRKPANRPDEPDGPRARAKAKPRTRARAKAKPKARRDWTLPFLAALEEGCTVAEASRAAGVHRSTAYDRRSDEDFARRWDELEEAATDRLEATAYNRAIAGSDRLMEVLLKARRPEKYRERFEFDHRDRSKAGEPKDVAPADPAERAAALRILADAGAIGDSTASNVVPIPKPRRRKSA